MWRKPQLTVLLAVVFWLAAAIDPARAQGPATPAGEDTVAQDPSTPSPTETSPAAPAEPAAAPAEASPPAPGEMTNLTEAPLEDLLEAGTRVASRKAKTIRETPAIVTLITAEEIVSSGSRDLIDVLHLVPGFTFAHDMMGVVTVGVRGVWGQEGKVLLLIDGHEINEAEYGTLQLGNDFPVDQIESVEVIRGPGSAMYGGHAELAVISVTTRSAWARNGASASLSYGQSRGDFARRNVGLTLKHAFDGGPAISVAGFIGEANRSDATYVDPFGSPYSMVGGNNRLFPLYLNSTVTYRDLSIRFLLDEYRSIQRDGAFESIATPVAKDFKTYSVNGSYRWRVTPSLSVVPFVGFRRQYPWITDDVNSTLFESKMIDRFTGRITLFYDVLENLNVVVGAEAARDRAQILLAGHPLSKRYFGQTEVSFVNVVGFGEATFESFLGNLSLGMRIENHSQFGPSFVPRAGISKVLGNFHLKLLYDRAFRVPDISPISLNPDVKPERTTSIQAEVGYQFTKSMFASINGFDTTIERPIVYVFENGTSVVRNNPTGTGSRGVEASFHMKLPRFSMNLNYTFYTARGKNTVIDYTVPGRPELLLAFPAHRVGLNATYTVIENLTVNASSSFWSERFGYSGLDVDGNLTLSRSPPLVLLNTFVNYQNLLVNGLDFGVGIHNLLDSKYGYIQGYGTGKPPLPAMSREYFARLSYSYLF